MEIPAPPDRPFCAGCNEPVTWLLKSDTWVAFVRCGCGQRWSFAAHRCRELQDQRVWREIPHGDPPNDLYLKVKSEIASKGAGS